MTATAHAKIVGAIDPSNREPGGILIGHVESENTACLTTRTRSMSLHTRGRRKGPRWVTHCNHLWCQHPTSQGMNRSASIPHALLHHTDHAHQAMPVESLVLLDTDNNSAQGHSQNLLATTNWPRPPLAIDVTDCIIQLQESA